MDRMLITKDEVELLLTGPKNVLRRSVKATINVDMTFHDLLDKVKTNIKALPPGMKINRLHKGLGSNTSVRLSCRIGDFLGTHYKRQMATYMVRLLLPRKSDSIWKATVANRATARIASQSATHVVLPSIIVNHGAQRALMGDLDEAAVPNESPENATIAIQVPGEAELGPQTEQLVHLDSKKGPVEASSDVLIGTVETCTGGFAVLREAEGTLENIPATCAVGAENGATPEVETATGSFSQVVGAEDSGNNLDRIHISGQNDNLAITCGSSNQFQQLQDNYLNAKAMTKETTEEHLLLEDTQSSSLVVPAPIINSLATLDSDEILEDMKRDGVPIFDIKTQAQKRLASVSNTLLLLAAEEKRKLEDKWQNLYLRAPFCVRVLEELLKE